MDWKTFFAAVIASVAWPAAVVTFVIILRKPLGRLVTLLRRLKWKDLELDFAERLEVAEKEADAAELPAPKPIQLGADEEPERSAQMSLEQLATRAPRAAIGEAWRQLEWRLRDALASRSVPVPHSSQRLTHLAREHNLVSPQVAGLIADLRALRNQAVHGRHHDLDSAQALEYVKLAERVALSLPGGSSLSGL